MDLTKPDPNSPAARRAAQRGTQSSAVTTTPATSNSTADAGVFSVSRLNREARLILEQGLANICVEGEISNLARPASGHWYFSLKDSNAQIRCAMFKQRNRLVRPSPQEGDKVQLRGKLTLYEARGDCQLAVQSMEAAGEGALKRAYELLRSQLEAEGLFAHERKKALPQWPQTIGVITSPSGAAVRDIIDVLRRRYAAANIVVYPTSVQGDNAATEIRTALRQASRRQEAQVLIIGRGGGSLEDLWAFNDEQLARDIAACPIPIVSAVGHETDFSLADFVADMRAPTPSAAAELVSPLTEDWLAWIENCQQLLQRHLQRQLQQQQQTLDSQQHRLQQQHPLRRLEPYQQRLEQLTGRLKHGQQSRLSNASHQLQALQLRLHRQAPQTTLRQLSKRAAQQQEKLLLAGRSIGQQARLQLAQLSAKLDVVSPLATLQRGYAIVSDSKQRAITAAGQVQAGDQIEIKLANGELDCLVEESSPTE